MIKTKTALQTDNDTNFTNNGTGAITGLILNAFHENLLDSLEAVIQTFTYAQILAIASPTAGDKVLASDFPASGNRTLFVYTGTYWKPCCGTVVLDVNGTQVGTDAATTEKTLATYSLPASYLLTNLDYVTVRATGQFAANNNLKTVKFKFGSTVWTVVTTGADGNSKYWTFEINIIRTSATVQVITGRYTTLARSGNLAAAAGLGVKDAGGETLSGAINISITGTNDTAAANDILFDEWTVTLHRK